MNKSAASKYKNYLGILKEELIPAMGCTEPAAIAYAAAKARETLGTLPERVRLEVSGNIVKNVKSVIIPGTGGLKGLKAAVAAGVIAGKAERKLEVIAGVEGEKQEEISAFIKETPIEIKLADSDRVLEIAVAVSAGDSNASVRIIDSHTNIVSVEKNGMTLFDGKERPSAEDGKIGGKAEGLPLEVAGIVNFADTLDIEDVRVIIERQIECNTAISAEGLKNNWGANIGKTLLKSRESGIKNRAKAAAAAGSDARMSGCNLPVIIVSGSGNQGMAVSLPVIEYAKALGKSREDLIRALVVSDLTAIHLKTGIGRLSAYCGVVAGAGAAEGIAYLEGGGMRVRRFAVGL